MHVLVMAKAPVPGRVKTRLCPPCNVDQAAALAEAALADTLAAAIEAGADRCVLALDGTPGPWLPPGVVVIAQRGAGLGARLDAAWAEVGGPGVQIGMDTPQVTGSLLADALDRLDDGADCLLGPATDGGWWAIALRSAHPALFAPVPMSRPDTGARQHRRCAALGLTVEALAPQRDVDTFTDALAVARMAPRTRFAAAVADLDLAVPAEGAAMLRATTGEVVPLDVPRWTDDATPAERHLLARSVAPVVDLGCGPGRHVVALAERGIPALGVDLSPAALGHARHRGATVLERSIFEPLPGSGRWGSALLLDGNIGIGGDPARLLARAAELLGPAGRLLVELEAPGSPSLQLTVRVEAGGRHGPWFNWSLVAADHIHALATATGWTVSDVWNDEGRWFAQLDR